MTVEAEMETGDERIVEERGAEWSFTYDLRAVPEYNLMVLRGKATATRNRKLLEAMQRTVHLSNGPDGTFYPTIVDIRLEGNPSMATMQAGQELMQMFGPRILYTVFVIDPHRRDTTVFRHILGILEKLTAGQRFTLTTSMEEAVEKVRVYHARHAHAR